MCAMSWCVEETEGRLWHGSFFPVYSWLHEVYNQVASLKGTQYLIPQYEINHFLPHYSKKKPGKLIGKEKAHHLGKGVGRKAGRNAIRSLQMDKLLSTNKPLKSPWKRKESAMAMYSWSKDWEACAGYRGLLGKFGFSWSLLS